MWGDEGLKKRDGCGERKEMKWVSGGGGKAWKMGEGKEGE